MRIPFTQVDAFTAEPFAGNPAAVMPLAAWLDDTVLQRIAEENNLSETAFIVASDRDDTDFELRWFTPTSEVAMCGHATLASGHVVLTSGWAEDRVRFLTRRSGMLEVARDEGGYRLALPSRAPAPRPLPAIVAALGLERAVATLWHPQGYALVVVEDEVAVRALDPDFRTLGGLSGAGHDGGEPDTLTIVTAPGDATDIVSRVFAPGAGIDEDPVTGSAHAVMVPYWADRLGRDRFTAFQASRRGGRLTCHRDGDRVLLGGACLTVIEGSFLLP